MKTRSPQSSDAVPTRPRPTNEPEASGLALCGTRRSTSRIPSSCSSSSGARAASTRAMRGSLGGGGEGLRPEPLRPIKCCSAVTEVKGRSGHHAVAVPANMRSILVAMMKSFSCSPLIFLVCKETVALPQPKLIFGWWPSASASSPISRTKVSASRKLRNRKLRSMR
jgi:hypothetical protein